MCLAMEKKQQKDEINGVIKFLRSSGTPESDIIAKVMEYVLALLAQQKV